MCLLNEANKKNWIVHRINSNNVKGLINMTQIYEFRFPEEADKSCKKSLLVYPRFKVANFNIIPRITINEIDDIWLSEAIDLRTIAKHAVKM